MSHYYYTVASLPTLFYERDLSISRDVFMEMCRTEMTPEDYRLIENTSMDNLEGVGPTCTVLREWRALERCLRNELARLRAQRKGCDTEKYVREGIDVFGVQEAARHATSESTPLQGEDALNRARWSFLDEIETQHHFDVEKLVIYCLKLQILERKALFDREKGTEVLEAAVEVVSKKKISDVSPN